MTNKRSFISSIGLLLSFIGMAGLVLSIISLLPLNGYNIYTTTMTILKLVEFEHERTNEKWQNITFSQEAKLYLIFLSGSFFSSIFEILLTFVACCPHQTNEQDQQVVNNIAEEEEGQDFLTLINDNNTKQPQRRQYNKNINKKSWFIRLACVTLLIQIIFSLFGTHIIYKIKSDTNVIPAEIQYNTFISCAILWINYLSLTLFAFILLFASFFILIGAYKQQKNPHHQQQNEETRPLII